MNTNGSAAMARVNENIAKGVRNAGKVKEVKNALKAFINANMKLKKAAEGANNNSPVNNFLNTSSVEGVANNVSANSANYMKVTNAAEKFYNVFKNFENQGLRMGDLELSLEEQQALLNARRLAGSIQRENVTAKANIKKLLKGPPGSPAWYAGGRRKASRKGRKVSRKASRKASRKTMTRRRR
jgi:hypothetical protein